MFRVLLRHGKSYRAFEEVAKRTYAQGVAVTKEVVNSVRMGRTSSLKKVKRAVQMIVDQVLTNETSIMGLTTLRDYDEYTFTHSVNVCVLNLAQAMALGIDGPLLQEIGIAGGDVDLDDLRQPLQAADGLGAGLLADRQRDESDQRMTQRGRVDPAPEGTEGARVGQPPQPGLDCVARHAEGARQGQDSSSGSSSSASRIRASRASIGFTLSILLHLIRFRKHPAQLATARLREAVSTGHHGRATSTGRPR